MNVYVACHMRTSAHRPITFVILALIISIVGTSSEVSARYASGRYVAVTPPFGKYDSPVRVFATSQEVDIMQRMQVVADQSPLAPLHLNGEVNWHVERSAQGSRTLALARRVWTVERQMLEIYGMVDGWKVEIIVARTQRYIRRTLREVRCYPSLESSGGVVLMGAALCDRRVIVINLTGYFFLRYPGQPITDEMETRPEPAIGSTSYLFVDRNMSGLAHEWAHVLRAQSARGNVRADEPYWFSEGWAQLMAGLGRVRAFSDRMTYLDYHVISLRRSYDWAHRCTSGLRAYRSYSDTSSQCIYYLGTLAVELLIAKYGGVGPMLRAFQMEDDTGNFSTAFRTVYGFSLEEFEKQADAYIDRLRAIA